LALSADGWRAVSGGNGTVRVWDIETGKEIYRFNGHTGGVWATVFTPDGKCVLSACGSPDGTMLLWEVPQHLRKVPGKK
jgi:WD40 repeat protein